MSLFDPEAMADLEARGLVSPARHAECEVSPSDFIVARRVGAPMTEDAYVAIGTYCEDDDHKTSTRLSIILGSEQARAFAAALLDAADEADGTTPLVFFPPGSPDGEEPQR